ncbi:GTPase Era, mitochondrial [Macrosteles quadrilineatus]|uniref:GTPase Era, mitochondrial n=1 Tax=Macrosteles quadrilineatus TaxID=74068 RepID=UPI0023E2C47D|nr:GTPase Era, mitochondrial [Macrosteles quadrilineatus]
MFTVKPSYKSCNIVLNVCYKCGVYRGIHDHLLGIFRRSFSEVERQISQPDVGLAPSLDENPLTKILKIAIIGTPNSGKSTFINQIVGRRVFAISNKVHTTRARARAVINIHDTQVIFLDTPGLVSQKESNKHNLEQTFLRDGELAITESNVIGVIHDTSNSFTRGKLDPKVLRLLHLYPYKHSVLILNKVDTVKKKRYLLELADRLSCKSIVDPDVNKKIGKRSVTEKEVMQEIKNQSGWPNFSQVFMVSALEGLGVGEVMEYLMQYAQRGRWVYSDDTFTDQKPEKVIVDTVKAKLLDYLPDELPYNIQVRMEMFNELEDGTLMAVVLVTCPHIRCEKMVIKRIRSIAQEVEAELRSTFLTQVVVKLSVETVG